MVLVFNDLNVDVGFRLRHKRDQVLLSFPGLNLFFKLFNLLQVRLLLLYPPLLIFSIVLDFVSIITITEYLRFFNDCG